jgi:hypothetical protein
MATIDRIEWRAGMSGHLVGVDRTGCALDHLAGMQR